MANVNSGTRLVTQKHYDRHYSAVGETLPLEVGTGHLSSVFGKGSESNFKYDSVLMQQGPGLCEEIVESEGG